jgi:hypothetical protein
MVALSRCEIEGVTWKPVCNLGTSLGTDDPLRDGGTAGLYAKRPTTLAGHCFRMKRNKDYGFFPRRDWTCLKVASK